MASSRMSRYSVGNKVYRGGSSAPTMGTVDPTGYVEREMASQRRSGLAAAALRRVQSPGVRFGQTTNKTPTPGTRPYDNPIAQSAKPITAGTGAYGGNVPRSIPQVQSNGIGKIIPAPTPVPQMIQPNGTSGHSRPSYDPSQPISISNHPEPGQPGGVRDQLANTQIMNYQGAAPVGIPMPYEQSMEQVSQLRQLQEALNGFAEQEQNVNRDYMTGTRDIELQKPGVFRGLLNNFAGRGMAFSSGYGDQYGETNSQFARMLADMAAQKNDALTGIARGRASANEGYNGAMAAIQAAATRALEAQAGNLGLGGTPESAGAEENPFEPGAGAATPPPFVPPSMPYGDGTNPAMSAPMPNLNPAPQAPAQALARPNAAQIAYEQSQYGPQAPAAAVQAGTRNDPTTALLWALYGNKPTAGSKPWNGR